MVRAAATMPRPQVYRWPADPSHSQTTLGRHWLTARSPSADHLAVVHRAPALWAHLHQHAGLTGPVVGGHGKVHLAHFWPEVADRHGADVALCACHGEAHASLLPPGHTWCKDVRESLRSTHRVRRAGGGGRP